MPPADPFSRSDLQPAETLSGADRDARIEQLLLAGLDAYFATQYEQAINLWTRVLFLDRHHDRARAYIDRARRTQAERQRETDAVLHQGIEAFHEGDVARAERLVTAALDRGASRDDAQGVLARIERLGIGRRAPLPGRRVAPMRPAPEIGAPSPMPAPRTRGWAAAALLAIAAFGVLGVGFWGLTLPEPPVWPFFAAASDANARIVMPLETGPLPVQGPSDAYLARARAHVQHGRLHDALRELDRVPIGDPARVVADGLRGQIQRTLLESAGPVSPLSLAVPGRPE